MLHSCPMHVYGLSHLASQHVHTEQLVTSGQAFLALILQSAASGGTLSTSSTKYI